VWVCMPPHLRDGRERAECLHAAVCERVLLSGRLIQDGGMFPFHLLFFLFFPFLVCDCGWEG